MQTRTIITDLHVEWHGETGMLHYVVEFEDGSEHTILTFMPKKTPEFPFTGCDEDKGDYQEWYNDALECAHEQGFVLEGELR